MKTGTRRYDLLVDPQRLWEATYCAAFVEIFYRVKDEAETRRTDGYAGWEVASAGRAGGAAAAARIANEAIAGLEEAIEGGDVCPTPPMAVAVRRIRRNAARRERRREREKTP